MVGAEPSDLDNVTRRFTGQNLDLRGGNYWTPFRTYSPTTGRWLQPDPLGMVNGPNMYAYVGGNPVNARDPLGLAFVGSRPLEGRDWQAGVVRHDQLFFEDGRIPTNLGFFDSGGVRPDQRWNLPLYIRWPDRWGLDDNVLRWAADKAQHLRPRHIIGRDSRRSGYRYDDDEYSLVNNNCQDFVGETLFIYDFVIEMIDISRRKW